MSTSDDVELLLEGELYRVGALNTKNKQLRDYMIAYGFIPGEVVRVVKKLFWGRYWVVRVHGQLVGLRLSEVRILKLYVIQEH